MRGKLKIHATAISIICVVIVVMYLIVGPKAPPPADPNPQGDRAIEIYSATWGETCNQFIDNPRRARDNQPPQKDAKGNIIPQPKLERVLPNNVLTAVSQHCNGKLTCSVTATSDELGVEPLANCFKRLKLSYRCFNYDRLWPIELNQGDSKTIDCHVTTTTPTK